MPSDLTFILPLAVLTFIFAGTIKGAVGIGLPTASIGIMSQAIDPRTAISLVIFPVLISNIWQVWRMGHVMGSIRRYWRLAVTLVVVLWFTVGITASVPQQTLLLILGAAIIGVVVNSWFFKPPPLPDRFDTPAQFLTGIACGVLGGLTAIWAPPIVAYLIARKTEKDEFVRATGFIFMLGTFPLVAGFWAHGLFTGHSALISAGMIIPTLIGFQIGEMLRGKIKAERFQTVVLTVFLIMGCNIIRRALTG